MTPPAFLDPSVQPRDGGILDLIYLPAHLRTSTTLPVKVAATLTVVESQLTALLRPATTARPDVPHSWHEAWLETDHTVRCSDVPDLTTGRWPKACDTRHAWTLVTACGTRDVTTVCTRRASHTGRHAAGAFGRVIAVWQDAQ